MDFEETEARGRGALDGVVVVLWETQDYVNIAGTVRAMRNFGLTRLRLVNPVEWDPYRIVGIAHGTQDVVDRIEVHASLQSALGDCSYVVGMTARTRRAKRAVARPRAIAPEVLSRALDATRGESGPVALLFGREDHGLSNEALDLCHRTAHIPTNPEHASLNLAQAVLVMAYELWMAAEGEVQPFRDPRLAAPPATVEFLEMVFADAERALGGIEFFKGREPEAVMRTVRELLRRSAPDGREAAFLRAIFIEISKFLERKGLVPAAVPARPPAEPPAEAPPE